MAGDVPTSTMQSFFHDDRAVEDLESKSLLSIAVTELVDGVFIACSMSHIVADGNSFWHFFNMWSEVFQQQIETGATLVLGLLQKFSAHHPGDCNGWGVERERESADHTISISSILVNDCTKFNISGKEFGILGKPIAFNFGDRTHMIDGYVYAYSDPDPDPTAAGDILVEVSLLPHTMRDLQADQEFMQFIS
nr:uncharacterized protein LOC125418615 [Ziziphus jujuba var. spinosa]